MNTYHKRFLSSFSSENVIGLFSRYRGASKEITESWAMLEAAKKFVPDIGLQMVIVVGDGASPRTGALLSYFTKAKVISVDPALNLSHWSDHVAKQTAMGFPPQRLRVIARKIEDIDIDCEGRPCVVLWPHSHADMSRTRFVNHGPRTDIAMPCCVKIPAVWMQRPHIVFEDENVLSPHRTVHVWQEKGKDQ